MPDLEYYDGLLERAPMDGESVTYLLVSEGTREDVAAAVGADLASGAVDHESQEAIDDADHSAYAIAEVSGGVLAMEPSGFADPTNAALRTLSAGGRTAAVARSNILGHIRFGYARDGEIVFDDSEYMYAEDFDAFPEEVRELAALTWDDLDGDEGPDQDPLTVAVAMAAQVTGLAVTSADLAAVYESGFYRTPNLRYAQDE